VRSVTNMGAIDDVMIEEYRHWRLNFWQSPSVGEPTTPPASIKSVAKQARHFGRPSATTLNR
jgi:hypothetical protein